MNIYVEGAGIGIGKTTLAKGLQRSFRDVVLLEEIFNDLYLKDMYQDIKNNIKPSTNVFEFECHILAERLQQYHNQEKDGIRIYDRSFASCLGFIYLLYEDGYLNKKQFGILSSLHKQLAGFVQYKSNDIVVWLNCPVGIQLERIKERNRPGEDAITKEYLERLDKSYTRVKSYFREKGVGILEYDWSTFQHQRVSLDIKTHIEISALLGGVK